MKANTSLTGTDIRTWNLHNYCRTKILMHRKSNTEKGMVPEVTECQVTECHGDRRPRRQSAKVTEKQTTRKHNVPRITKDYSRCKNCSLWWKFWCSKVTFEKDGVDEIRRIYIIYSSFHRIHHWERNAAISTWNCAKLGTSGPNWTDQEMEERVKATYPEVRNSPRFRHDGTGNPPVAPTQGK